MAVRSLLILILLTSLLFGKDVSYDYELDAYYSNVSLFFEIGDDKVVDATEYTESEIYNTLFLNTFNPNIFLIL